MIPVSRLLYSGSSSKEGTLSACILQPATQVICWLIKSIARTTLRSGTIPSPISYGDQDHVMQIIVTAHSAETESMTGSAALVHKQRVCHSTIFRRSQEEQFGKVIYLLLVGVTRTWTMAMQVRKRYQEIFSSQADTTSWLTGADRGRVSREKVWSLVWLPVFVLWLLSKSWYFPFPERERV